MPLREYRDTSSMKLSMSGSRRARRRGRESCDASAMRGRQVETTGIEPATYGLQSHRSPS